MASQTCLEPRRAGLGLGMWEHQLRDRTERKGYMTSPRKSMWRRGGGERRREPRLVPLKHQLLEVGQEEEAQRGRQRRSRRKKVGAWVFEGNI